MSELATQLSRKRLAWISFPIALLALLSACSRAPVPEAVTTPKGLMLAGQKVTCGNGPRNRTFLISAMPAQVNLGMGFTTKGWTFGGSIPAPVIEACEGDTVTIKMSNQDTDPVYGTDHGFDSHAFQIDAAKFNSVGPGKTLQFSGKMEVPGAFMYHCSVGSATDWHIKSGMYGAMVVYPRKSLRDAKEILVIQSAVYGKPDKSGNILQMEDWAKTNDPYFMMFNGQLQHEPVKVKAGDLVLVYFVNVGPGTSAVHVIGSILDRFYISGNPENVVYDVQTERVPPGGGAMFEFRPPKGQSLLVDHNNLRFLDYNFAIPFVAE